MKRCYDFGPEQVASIDALAEKLGIDKTDVLTTGLRLLRVAVREARQGNDLGIVRGGQVVSRLDGAWSELAQMATA